LKRNCLCSYSKDLVDEEDPFFDGSFLRPGGMLSQNLTIVQDKGIEEDKPSNAIANRFGNFSNNCTKYVLIRSVKVFTCNRLSIACIGMVEFSRLYHVL